MTAEVAVGNKNAIALAADSAVTVTANGSSKVINGANKLFQLDQQFPVGLMFYGNAELVGVPLEALIKQFRSTIGSQQADLSIYAEQFWAFVADRLNAAPQELKEKQALEQIVRTILFISSEVKNEWERQKSQKGRKGRRRICTDTVRAIAATLETLKTCHTVSSSEVRQFRDRNKDGIDYVITKHLGEFEVDDATVRRIYNCIDLALISVPDFLNYTGVVFAGYGHDSLYPSVRHYKTSGFIGERLAVCEELSNDFGEDLPVGVWPYAQQKMVYAFMEGIDPDLENIVLSFMEAALDHSQNRVLNEAYKLLNTEQRRQLKAAVAGAPTRIVSTFAETIQQFKNSVHSGPVLDALRFMPKEHLAEVAESLVNLTSFRRRVSLDLETVGGPIDVAVISPGDGFVWIKRKHYFEPGLNPAFFSRFR